MKFRDPEERTMAVDVIMPQMGESIFEGTITKWLKKPGDKIERDEPLFEISTDKVDAEIPSPSAGVLKEIKVNEGPDGADSDDRGADRCGRRGAATSAAAPAPRSSKLRRLQPAQAKPAPAPPAPHQKPRPRLLPSAGASPASQQPRCRVGERRKDSQLAAGSPHGPRKQYRSRAGAGHRRGRPREQAGYSGGRRRRRRALR